MSSQTVSMITSDSNDDKDSVPSRRVLDSLPPRNLRRTSIDTLLLLAADLISSLAWFGMLIYALLLWRYRNVLVRDIPISAETLLTIATVLSTLFSILFAATFARVLRSISLYLLETGSRIDILDQLVGSLSLSSTLISQFSIGFRRSLTSYLIGFNLVILWLLSPFGSQALLRTLSLPASYTVTDALQPYLNVSAYYNIGGDSSDSESYLLAPNALMNAVVASSISSKTQLTDPWGYVKIPEYSRMAANLSDSEGWRPVNVISTDDFSSLLGLPTAPWTTAKNQMVTFSVESWYWDLSCDPWTASSGPNETWQEFLATTRKYQKNSTVSSRGYSYVGPVAYIWFNVSGSNTPNSRTMEACNIPSNDPRFRNTSAHSYDVNDCTQLEARNISIQLNSGKRAFLSHCQIATQYVETDIDCTGTVCLSTRIRKSTLPHLSRNWTALDIMTGNYSLYSVPSLFFGNFANAVPGDTAGAWGDNALTGYIVDPSNPTPTNQLILTGDYDKTIELWNITDSLITLRLNQLLNTYWMATVGSALITATDKTWRTIQDKNISSRSTYMSADSDTPIIVTAPVILSTPERKLYCDLLWLTIFTTISAISLLSALSGLALSLRINAPRLSMNISSMLRDSRYSDLGSAGSYLDDSDRTFLNRNIIVRIGDVAPASAVGHIALCTVESASSITILGKLDKNRTYD